MATNHYMPSSRDSFEVIMFATNGQTHIHSVPTSHCAFFDMNLPFKTRNLEHLVMAKHSMSDWFSDNEPPTAHPMFDMKCRQPEDEEDNREDLSPEDFDVMLSSDDWAVVEAVLVDEDGIHKRLKRNAHHDQFLGQVCIYTYMLSYSTGISLDLDTKNYGKF